jgi:hypothetical protein
MEYIGNAIDLIKTDQSYEYLFLAVGPLHICIFSETCCIS